MVITKQTKQQERDRLRREKLAAYFLDLSKLTFAGLVLGGLSPLLGGNLIASNWSGLVTGLFSTLALAVIGNKIMK